MNIEFLQRQISDITLVTELWGNTVYDYIVAVLIFVIFVIIFRMIQLVVLHRLETLAKRTKTDVDDTIIAIVRSLRPSFYYFVAFFGASQFLELTSIAERVVNTVLLIWIVFQGIIAIQILIDFVVEKKFKDADIDGDGESDDDIINFMSGLLKGIVWVVALLMILSNLGINVTSLMAGLGIGGLAIAFALQNVFADLFAAFSIYLDKPFRKGDLIVSGVHTGHVEKIGIKTTRIRALQGEEIVISNQELTSARVQNFKKLHERRIRTEIGVVYETPSAKLQKIPKIIEEVITEIDGSRFNRAYFTTFGDSALIFEFVYHVESDEYADFLKAQQTINFKIKEVFEKEGIDMAFPTQTIHLVKS